MSAWIIYRIVVTPAIAVTCSPSDMLRAPARNQHRIRSIEGNLSVPPDGDTAHSAVGPTRRTHWHAAPGIILED